MIGDTIRACHEVLTHTLDSVVSIPLAAGTLSLLG